MLLSELFVPFKKPISTIKNISKPRDMSSFFGSLKKRHTLGSGQNATVYSSPNPNIVIKQFSPMAFGDGDATMQFYRLAVKHQENPYFPKILSIKQYKHDDSRNKLPIVVVKMEKLHSLSLVDEDALVNLIQLSNIQHLTREEKSDHIREIFNSNDWVSTLIKKTSDIYLKKALRLLKPLLSKYGSDLILSNFMVRHNGMKNQLVFTDPLDDSF